VAFSHLGLYVRELAAMEDFYSRVMGFTVTDRGELDSPAGRVSLVFLSRDPQEHHQLLLVTGRPDTAHYNVINQISFRVDGLPSLRHFHGALQKERVTELSPLTHGNAISLYFRDPEGNRVEVFFDTPWYCSQPCREPIDLSKTDAELLAWTEKLARGLPGFKSREAWSAELRRKMTARATPSPA
jgi:catechol 2,3-dioxygenase-like lactoylglutathione lyase family enzyme